MSGICTLLVLFWKKIVELPCVVENLKYTLLMNVTKAENYTSGNMELVHLNHRNRLEKQNQLPSVSDFQLTMNDWWENRAIRLCSAWMDSNFCFWCHEHTRHEELLFSCGKFAVFAYCCTRCCRTSGVTQNKVISLSLLAKDSLQDNTPMIKTKNAYLKNNRISTSVSKLRLQN